MSGHIQTVDDHEWEELLLAVDQFVCSYYSTKALTPMSPHTDTVAIIGAVYNLRCLLPPNFLFRSASNTNNNKTAWHEHGSPFYDFWYKQWSLPGPSSPTIGQSSGVPKIQPNVDSQISVQQQNRWSSSVTSMGHQACWCLCWEGQDKGVFRDIS